MRFLPIITGIALSTVARAEESPLVEYAFGVLEESRGRIEAAAARFEAARLLDPNAAPLVEIAAQRLLDEGDRPGAIRLRRELAEARPDDFGIQIAYADFLTTHGKGDALAVKLATETLEAGLEAKGAPDHPGIRADQLEIIRRLFAIHQ